MYIIHQQSEPSTDVFSTVSTREEKLQIILPAVVGVLALAIIAAISICFIGVMIAQRRKSDNNLGGEKLYMHVYINTCICM